MFIIIVSAIFAFKYATSVRKAAMTPKMYSIRCLGGTFTFLIDDYPVQEFIDFQAKAAPFCKGKKVPAFIPNQANSKPSPQHISPATTSPKTSGSGLRIAIIVGIILLVFGGVWFAYRSTHCKYPGCDETVYEAGYCKYHYTMVNVDQTIHGAFNQAGDIFGGLFG